jgi:hypothetical protein
MCRTLCAMQTGKTQWNPPVANSSPSAGDNGGTVEEMLKMKKLFEAGVQGRGGSGSGSG